MHSRGDFAKQRAKFRAAILHDTALSVATRLVGYEIADLVHTRTHDAWPSQEWLAQRLGLAVRTVRRAVAELVKDGWFTAELDGRSWRYIPNQIRWADGSKKADKLSGVDTGHPGTEVGQIVRSTSDKKVPLSSLSTQIKNEPQATAGRYSETEVGALQRLGEVVERRTPSDASLTQFARKQGAPQFVFENSEPWKAWLDYRKRNGLPPSLPVRQHMIGGRARSGWHMPTLWPPGYGPGGVNPEQSGAA